MFYSFLLSIIILAHKLLSIKENIGGLHTKQTLRLTIQDQVRNLRIDWAINPIDDC